MKIINRSRCSGKTSMLISSAYISGNPILTYTNNQKEFIIALAKRMHCEGILVFTIDEYKEHKLSSKYPNILIDNLDLMFEKLLSQYTQDANVVAATMSIFMEEVDFTKVAN